MKAREYDKRVSIYQVSRTSDGFAGYTTGSPVLLETRWAKVEYLSQASAAQLRQEYGLNLTQELVRFTFRDFDFSRGDCYLTYGAANYQPIAAQPADQYGVDISVIGVKQ